VVEATEGEHHAEQQPDRQQHGDVLHRAEPDQFQHDPARILEFGRAVEHPGHLVGQQDDQQDAGDAEPARDDLAQDVAVEDTAQGQGFPVRIESSLGRTQLR
jgi:hypothetical protein